MTSRTRTALVPGSTYTADQISRTVAAARALRGVDALRRAALAIESEFTEELARTAPVRRESMRNLLHYLAVRRHDLRELQIELSRLGLSSLGRMEAHVLASLNAVLDVLVRLDGQPHPGALRDAPAINFDTGDAVLAEHAVAALGHAPGDRSTRIMVTMASDAAEEPSLLHDLVAEGMDLIRINCAHDDSRVWTRMVRNLRAAEKKLGRSCRISVDLAGPKLRTGPVAPGPAVVRWRPQRNAYGEVIAPAIVRLVRAGEAGTPAPDGIPVDRSFLARVRCGDGIALSDARGRNRSLTVVERSDDGCVCTTDSTAYVMPGTELALLRGRRAVARGKVGSLPSQPGVLVLHPGDPLDLILGDEPGRGPVTDASGKVTAPAQIACALPEVFRSVRVGERVLFDDGKILGVIAAIAGERIRVEIRQCVGGSAKLRGEKGINFPDSDLKLPALTAKDRADLEFAAKHADLVALSFVQQPEDIEDLIAELQRIGASRLAIVLKIETQRAFRDLPRLLITAMRHPRVAVMVARGDLGVEVGFERLSEVQEEILWLCEAAHVPVIWATQVLESLAKGGVPSRAEVTDAAMGARTECVMLNKGPYIRETLRFLRDVITRMKAHHDKKTALLRKLSISEVQPLAPPRPTRTKRPR